MSSAVGGRVGREDGDGPGLDAASADARNGAAALAPVAAAALAGEPVRGGGAATQDPSPSGDGDVKGSIVKPRPGTEADLREACAIDLDAPKPEHPKAARVWVAGRRKRELDRRREQVQSELDTAMTDYVTASREERDAKRLDTAKALARHGVDLEKLLALAAEGKLPDVLAG